MSPVSHFDSSFLSSYSLGVLDERDAARFEDHLIECPQCAYELESFVQVADLLADVDANALIATEESRRDSLVLARMIDAVARDRSTLWWKLGHWRAPRLRRQRRPVVGVKPKPDDPGQEARDAAKRISHGLDQLFRRLGPPPEPLGEDGR